MTNSLKEGDSYELGMQIPQRDILRETQTGMRPRGKRLRPSGPFQLSAKGKVKSRKEKQIREMHTRWRA